MRNQILSAAVAAAILTGAVAAQGECQKTCEGASGAAATAAKSAKLGHASPKAVGDIVDVAIANGSFKTLVAAVQAAGLVDTLKGKGPFTVFAPTDEAFAKLPKETLADLLKPENKAKLVEILTYHVVAAEVPAADAAKLDFAGTVQGGALRIVKTMSGDETTLTVDGAKVVKADVKASNGVIHVIDTVVLPRPNLAETAKAAGSFKTLLAAAEAAGLVPALTGKDALTVFAPTDDAFAKLPAGTVESLLRPENKEKLAAVIKFHVVAGRALAKDVVAKTEVATLNGKAAKITTDKDGAKIEGAKIVKTDVLAGNGVIHVIDAVILP
jgi:transforming growth factor-beta-induced protein